MAASHSEYFYRIVTLLVDGGTKVLRALLLKHVQSSPYSIQNFLISEQRKILDLRRKKVFHQEQMDKMFPPSGQPPDIGTFDLTILCNLLTDTCSVTPQELSAIESLRESRNKVYGHTAQASLTLLQFQTFWQDISLNIISLASSTAEQDFINNVKDFVAKVKTGPLDIQSSVQALSDWYRCEFAQLKQDVADCESELQHHATQLDSLNQQQTQLRNDFTDLNTRESSTAQTLCSLETVVEKLNLSHESFARSTKEEIIYQRTEIGRVQRAQNLSGLTSDVATSKSRLEKQEQNIKHLQTTVSRTKRKNIQEKRNIKRQLDTMESKVQMVESKVETAASQLELQHLKEMIEILIKDKNVNRQKMEQRIENTKRMLDDHRVISNKYLIKPKAYGKAKEVLLEHGHLILTGIPGSGKTFMAKSLIQEVVTSDANYTPIKISTAAEWKELVDTEIKQVVFVDDFLGKYRVCENDICEWRSLADLIIANIKAKYTLLVLTIRHFSLKSVVSPTIVIYNSTDQLFSLLDGSVTIDLSSKKYTMTHEEKQTMLEHYMLVDKIDLDRNKVDGICQTKRALGFPQVCKIVTTCKENVHTEEAYSDPDQMVLSELHRIDKENKPLIAALVLTMLSGGKTSLQNFHKNLQKTESILTYFGLSVQDLGEIGKCLESACGTYLTLSEGKSFIFNHDTTHADVLKFFLNKNRQLTLECCSLQLLCTLCTVTSIVTKTTHTDDIWNDILVSVHDITLIQNRFKMALTTGNAGDFTNIAEAKIWNDVEFREFVYSNCSFSDLSKNLFLSSDENKKTLFAHFCSAGRLEIVTELTYRLERASPSTLFKDQIVHALEESVKHVQFKVVNFLLSRNTKVTDKAILACARKGNVDIMKLLLQHGGSVKSKGENGRSLLHEACLCNQLTMCTYLIEQNREMLFDEDKNGVNPIHIAAVRCNIPLLKHLLSCGVDSICKTVDGQTILHAACQGGNIEMVKHITSSYPDMLHVEDNDGRSVLHTAAWKGHINVLEHLFGCGVRPMCKTVDGQTILHAACQGGNIEMVKHIISSFPDMLHVKDNDGRSVLHTAAWKGHINVLEHLHWCGVDPMCKTVDGQTILHVACQGGNIEMVKHIISSFPDMLHVKANDGRSVLHTAAWKGHINVLEHLLGCGVVPMCKTVDGLTILQAACQDGNIEMVKHIISSYPDMLHVKDNNGLSVIHTAAWKGHINVLEHLLSCGVDPMCKTVDGQTILHAACQDGNIEMVKYIISSYPDMLHVLDGDGWSVTHYTVLSDNARVLQYLIGKGLNLACRTNTGKGLFDIAKQYKKHAIMDFLLQ